MLPILPIDNANTSSTAATTTSDVSDISISSSSCMFCLETDSLAPSPTSANRNLTFGTAALVAHIDITDKENGEISIEDTDLIPHSPPFSPAAPAKIQISIEKYKEHQARPIPQYTTDQLFPYRKASTNTPNTTDTTDTTNTTDATSSVPRTTPTADEVASAINRDLNQLYTTLRDVFEPVPNNPIDSWEYESEDSWNDEDDDRDNGFTDDSPPQGDSTHPPSQWVCGEHPGMGWELNDPLTTSYYRVLIPDPTTNHLVIAPFISYAVQHSKAEVQATYGKGYPIHTHVLQPIPVDYFCPSLTPDQLAILDSRSPFAEAVNKIINQKFPLHISAAIKRYQHFQEEKYSSQQHIHRLQEREHKYLEKAMCVLSELENANVLGRIVAHDDDILDSLAADHRTARQFLKIARSFEGTIPQSAIDARANPFRAAPSAPTPTTIKTSPSLLGEYIPLAHRRNLSKEECDFLDSKDEGACDLAERRAQNAEDLLREAADKIEETLRDRLVRRKDRRQHKAPARRLYNDAPIAFRAKKCFCCGRMGHIRAACPLARRPWDIRK